MSGKFHGFSQDYIEKLKSNPKTNKENSKNIEKLILWRQPNVPLESEQINQIFPKERNLIHLPKRH